MCVCACVRVCSFLYDCVSECVHIVTFAAEQGVQAGEERLGGSVPLAHQPACRHYLGGGHSGEDEGRGGW